MQERTEYRVEKVLGSRTVRGGVKEYLVKWRGWDDLFNSWVKGPKRNSNTLDISGN